MEFEGVQRCFQRCQCLCFKDSIKVRNSKICLMNGNDSQKRIAATIQAKEEVVKHDSVNVENAKNQGLIEIYHPKFVCLHCEMLLKRVSNFLKNLKKLDDIEWSNICGHCREIKSTKQCKKCSYLVSKIKKGKEYQDTQQWKDIKDILNQVILFLETITINKRSVNSCEIAPDYEDLAKMFKFMQIPSANQEEIKDFFDEDVFKYENTWKDLDNLSEGHRNTPKITKDIKKMALSPVRCNEKEICISKKLAKKSSEHLSFTNNKEEKLLTSNIINKNVMNKKNTNVSITSNLPLKCLKTCKKNIKVPGDVKEIGKKSDKIKAHTSSDLFMKMILKERKQRNRPGAGDPGLHVLINAHGFKGFSTAKIDGLPALSEHVLEEKIAGELDSILVCNKLRSSEKKEVIQVNKVITQKQNYKQLRHQHRLNREPLLYEVQHNFSYKTVQQTEETTYNNKENISEDNVQKKIGQGVNTFPQSSITKGTTKYQLSNKRYIEDGLTALPTLKIRRRVNVYKMIPSLPKFDWLEKYRNQGLMYYNSGEKLAEISDGGQARWYYKDGSLALDFRNSKDISFTDEFLIYDSFELRKKTGQAEKNLLLACFDKMGHGIVYDRKGRIRLKYNQCEGINLDKDIGPIARWKWNNLNDPPELQQVFEDTHLDRSNSCLINLVKGTEQNETQSNIFDIEMYTTELHNYVNQNSRKMRMKYKPYQIRLKVLKLNKHFTLKILDQTKIYLLFSDSKISFKLNLGMRLVSNEIIEVKTVDFNDVATPYDK